MWRVGSKVPINVYDGHRPVCQCHTAEDAAKIVAAINGCEQILKLSNTDTWINSVDAALEAISIARKVLADAKSHYDR